MNDYLANELVLKLGVHQYAHITNDNDNGTVLITGPMTRTLGSDERLTKPITPFHVVPHGHYCCIENPHEVAEDGVTPVCDKSGQVKVSLGKRKIFVGPLAVPLYPEEKLVSVEPLTVLDTNSALLVRVIHDYTSEGGVRRSQGERYLFKGPGTYFPRVEETPLEVRHAVNIKKGCAIRLRALELFTDRTGRTRKRDDEYLYLTPGSYLCDVDEQFVEHVEPLIIPPDEALHVEVLRNFVDERPNAFNRARHAGEVYVVTHEDCPMFVPHPNEKILRTVHKMRLTDKQYAVIVNASKSRRRTITNVSYYLQVDEEVENDAIRGCYLLGEGQALLLRALDMFQDESVEPPVQRVAEDLWLLHGPREYVPHSLVEVCKDKNGNDIRERILLCDGDGIYVRDKTTGVVRTVTGPAAYMLGVHEELWEKSLPPDVEGCLQRQLSPMEGHIAAGQGPVLVPRNLVRSAYKTVVYKVPHRSVTQLYNYRTMKTRTIFGPDRVTLEPDEEFTVVKLSLPSSDGTSPAKCQSKESSRVNALHLFLGPSNVTDIVHVETRDHAQLALQLCYAWHFDVAHGDEAAARKCFGVDDFIADACSLIAGRIRAAVASLPFQQFHKSSVKVLQQAVFGINPVNGDPMSELRFDANNFVVTSVDTHTMEVLDPRTREGLQKSVKIAIEMSTQAQESSAQQVALAREQQSSALLAQQKMKDQVENETQRKALLEAETKSAATISSGRFRSAADSAAKAASVEEETNLKCTRVRMKSEDIMNGALCEIEQNRRTQEHQYEAARASLEREFKRELSKIENDKFAAVMSALGPDTVEEIAKAGPELQAKLLESLGLQGYLVMDGSTPINLFNTASELTGHVQQ